MMACQAAVAIVARFLFGWRQLVWIMAGDAAELTGAGLEAAAGIHLLDVAGELAGTALAHRSDKHGPEIGKRQSGPEIEGLPSPAEHASNPLQMALLADRLAQGRRQAGGIDDGIVGSRQRPGLRLADVQFARPVAALTANRQAIEYRLLIAIAGSADRLGLVGVAEQTECRHGSLQWPKSVAQVRR